MSRYKRHVFICINERPPDHPKGCCALKGSPEVRDALRAEIQKRGLRSIVRINNAGCLDACEHGISMVVYPEGIWYVSVKKEDVPEIVDRTIINGEVIERLLMNDPRYAPSALHFGKLEPSTPNQV